MYLKDQSGLTVGREDFEAVDTAQARVIASAIWNACSDIAFGFELWRKDEHILPPQEPTASGAALSDYERQTVIATMVALRDSNWLITASEKLVREIESLRASSTSGASQADGGQAGPIYSPFERFIAGIKSPALRAIAKHWSEVRCDKSMPSWDDLSSSALAAHFKLLWGYQFDRRNGEFTGRACGHAYQTVAWTKVLQRQTRRYSSASCFEGRPRISGQRRNDARRRPVQRAPVHYRRSYRHGRAARASLGHGWDQRRRHSRGIGLCLPVRFGAGRIDPRKHRVVAAPGK